MTTLKSRKSAQTFEDLLAVMRSMTFSESQHDELCNAVDELDVIRDPEPEWTAEQQSAYLLAVQGNIKRMIEGPIVVLCGQVFSSRGHFESMDAYRAALRAEQETV